jgi:spore photoproduct lyase
MRNTIFTTGPDLPNYLKNMQPMFSDKKNRGSKRPKSGKYSFSQKIRIEIFGFVIDEIKKYSDCKIALCKESAAVWKKLNMPLSRCSCVCQLDFANMA